MTWFTWAATGVVLVTSLVMWLRITQLQSFLSDEDFPGPRMRRRITGRALATTGIWQLSIALFLVAMHSGATAPALVASGLFLIWSGRLATRWPFTL